MAPEIFQMVVQTTKMDIWSMAVLILEVLDLLPKFPFESLRELQAGDQTWFRMVVERAREQVPDILPMLEVDPRNRYTARECLEHIFGDDARVLAMPQGPPSGRPGARQRRCPGLGIGGGPCTGRGTRAGNRPGPQPGDAPARVNQGCCRIS